MSARWTTLGAIGGPLLALALVGLIGVRGGILLSLIPGLLAAAAIVYAIRHTPALHARERQPIRLRVRPVMRGRLGQMLAAAAAFEFGNVAGSAFGLLAALQAAGNLAASAIAGILWTTISPTAAFLYAAAWMTVALTSLTLTPPGRQGEFS